MWIGRQQATSSIQVTKMPFEALQNVDFGHNFIVLSQVEASNLYICVEKNTFQEFVCKVSIVVSDDFDLLCNRYSILK